MNVLMPQLGETVAEGKVAVWHKKEGDSVSKDEILADVETDKAAVEIPSPAEGVIGSLLVPEGETVDVGTVIAIIKNSNSESTEQSNVVEEKITSVSSAKTEAAAKISKPQKTLSLIHI